MSDDFIPLSQSTPVSGQRNHGRSQNHRGFQYNRYQGGQRRGGRGHNQSPRWVNNSRNSSYGSDSNSSFVQANKNNIDAYLHPSMLQDPWASLRERNK